MTEHAESGKADIKNLFVEDVEIVPDDYNEYVWPDPVENPDKWDVLREIRDAHEHLMKLEAAVVDMGKSMDKKTANDEHTEHAVRQLVALSAQVDMVFALLNRMHHDIGHVFFDQCFYRRRIGEEFKDNQNEAVRALCELFTDPTQRENNEN